MDRRQEIYEKALSLFLARGYDNTPVSEIAKSLNLTKAGLYHYFSSKEELLFSIHNESIRKGFVPMLDAAEKIVDPRERIRFFIKNYVVKTVTKDPSIKIAIHDVKKLKPEYQEVIIKDWQRVFNLIRGALDELISAGRIRSINTTFATFAALGMCSWTIYWFDYNRKDSAKELADTFIQIFFGGLEIEAKQDDADS